MHLECSVSVPGTVKLFHRNAGLFTKRRTRLWAVYFSSSCENVKIRLLIFLSLSLFLSSLKLSLPTWTDLGQKHFRSLGTLLNLCPSNVFLIRCFCFYIFFFHRSIVFPFSSISARRRKEKILLNRFPEGLVYTIVHGKKSVFRTYAI